MAYDLGDVVPLAITVKDSTGALADATAVACVITGPDGTVTTASVTHVSTGSYTADHAPTGIGRYLVQWDATGSNAGAYDDVFLVRDAPRWIIGLADAKAELNITASVDDEELRGFLDEAHDLVERQAGVTLAPRSRTEYLPGGTDTIPLPYPPVRSVTSVTVDGTAWAATSYELQRIGDLAWLRSPGTTFGYEGDEVAVTYAAGWTSPPPAATRAVRAMLAHLWATQRGAMSGRNPFGGDTTAPNGAAYLFPYRVQSAIDLLKSVSF